MKKLFAERMRLIKPSALSELFRLGVEPGVISFGGGFPDPTLFPVDKMSEAFGYVLSKHGNKALQYATPQGLPSLRQKLAARLSASGISCSEQQLVILHGGQQGLDLIAKLFLDKGDVIVVENPTFLGALSAFCPYEPQYACVPMDDNGMDMQALEYILKNTPQVKFIYTVPDFQNPTGRTMSLERRRRMVELANQYNIAILEDSPYREIRYEGSPVQSIKSFDTEERVLHLGSFAKILCPGLRLGWLVASEEIISSIGQLKMAADSQCSTLNMYLIDAFFELFDIDEHIDSIRRAYKNKKDLMLETMRQTFPAGISYTNPEGGLFTWLTFPEGANATVMMKERLLPEAQVAYVPGDAFFATLPEYNHCRVNYSCMPEDKIVLGVSRMGKIFREYFSDKV